MLTETENALPIAAPATNLATAEIAPLSISSAPPPSPVTSEQRVLRARAALRAALDAGVDDERVGRLHFECGRVCEIWAGDLQQARDHYLRAQELGEGHLPTLAGLRRVLVALGETERALPLFELEAARRAPERRALLLLEQGRLLEQDPARRAAALDCYERACEISPDNLRYLQARLTAALAADLWQVADAAYAARLRVGEEEAAWQAVLLSRRASLAAHQRGDCATAVELYQAALRAAPDVPERLLALADLCEVGERWTEVSELLRRQADLAIEPLARALPLQRLARIQADRLADKPGAIESLLTVSELLPDDGRILEDLSELCRDTRDHAHLAIALERLAELPADPIEQAELWRELGRVRGALLDDPDGAIVAWRRACDACPDSSDAWDELRLALEASGRWRDLAQVHEDEGETASSERTRAAAYAAASEVQERQLGDLEEAIRLHRCALGVCGTYEPSVRALERMLEELGRFDELAELYASVAADTADPELRASILERLAQIQESALNAPSKALETYQQLRSCDTSRWGRIRGWQRAAERAGQWHELVQALEFEAEAAPNRQGDLLRRAGQILEYELGQPEDAAVMYERAVRAQPADPLASRELRLLYRRQGSFERLRDTLERELEATTQSERKAELEWRLGMLMTEHLDQKDSALEHIRRASRTGFAPARRVLDRALAEAGLHGERIRELEKQVEAASSSGERAQLETRIGALYEQGAGQYEEALAAYERALALDRAQHEAMAGRGRCLLRSGDGPRLACHFGELAEAEGGPVMAIAARLRQAEILRDRTADRGRAIESFEAVLAIDSRHLGALEALEALYHAEGRWGELARVLVLQIKALAEPRSRVVAMHRLLEVGGVAGIDRAKTPQANAVLLEQSPDDWGALLRFETLAIQGADLGLLANLAERLAELEEDPGVAATYVTWLGEVAELEDAEAGVIKYRRALELDAACIGAMDGLGRIAQMSGDPVLLEEAAEHQQRAGRRLRAAELYAQSAEQAAAEQRPELIWPLVRALVCSSRDTRAIDLLVAALVEAESIEEHFSEVAAGFQDRPAEQSDLWLAVARRLAGHPQIAVAVLERAHEVLPARADLLTELGRLSATLGDFQQAAQRLEAVLGLEADTDLSSVRLELAALYGDELGRDDEAACLLEGLANDGEVAPEHRATALTRLLSLRRRRGELEQAAEVAAQLARSGGGPELRLEALRELGDLRRELGQLSRAAIAYSQAVEVEGEGGESACRLRRLLDENGDEVPQGWRDYLTALGRYAASQACPEDALGSTLESARVLAEHLAERDEACRMLEWAVEANPGQFELRLALAEHQSVGQPLPEALATYRALLDCQPTNHRVWRSLSEALGRVGQARASALALQPVLVLGEAQGDEEERMLAVTPGEGFESESRLVELRDSLPTPQGPESVGDLVRALGEYLPKLYPGRLRELALQPRDRIAASAKHPARSMVDRLENLFGLGKFQLYVTPDDASRVTVVYSNPLSLLLPRDFAELSPGEQAFLVAKPMFMVAERLHAVENLDAKQLRDLFESTLRAANGDVEASFTGEHRLAHRLRRAASAEALDQLRPLAKRAFETGDEDSLRTWLDAVRAHAVCVALLVAEDLVGCVRVLERLEGVPHGLGREDLFRFWLTGILGAASAALPS